MNAETYSHGQEKHAADRRLVERHRATSGLAARRLQRALIERLEERRHFAVTVQRDGGALVVTGDDNANAITVSLDDQGSYVVTPQDPANPGPFRDVTLIDVDAKGGNDTVTISVAITVNTGIGGGAGIDEINGGTGKISSPAGRTKTSLMAAAAMTCFSGRVVMTKSMAVLARTELTEERD